MSSFDLLTPTEALLHVAKTNPFLPAVRCSGSQWSYAALWARVREISNHIDTLEPTEAPVGLYMGLEIDYVAAAHAIWLSGRTVVFLSTKWTPAVIDAILERTSAKLILHGNYVPPPINNAEKVVSTLSLVNAKSTPAFFPAPLPDEEVSRIPVICSVTPTSGSTGVPKSIVYPMKKSLGVLTEESSTLLKPRDGQWLRGGTTFLRPLFELRRFMYNQTTLYLDPSSSIGDQCAALCAELESPRNVQPLRVHFTPSVFRAFADYVRMRNHGNQPSGFWRVYWMVIGGESLSTRDLDLAKVIFPEATIACNYACSEVGFAGVCQMFVRPTDPVPETISYGPTQGCTDLVLLDANLRVIPKSDVGATGIVGIISDQSAIGYLDNADATKHMFRRWGRTKRFSTGNGQRNSEVCLYTDDIGKMTKDGRIVINGRQSRNVKVNGLFVDLDYVERALANEFASDNSGASYGTTCVTAYKLVKSVDEKIILFFTAVGTANSMEVLKRAREALKATLGDSLATIIHSTRCIPEMPFNASYKVDLVKLQTWADSAPSTPAVSPPLTRSNTPGPPGLGGRGGLMPPRLDIDILAANPIRPTIAEASALDGHQHMSKTRELALEIAAEVGKLCRATEAVPTDVPLMYAGLNSITVVQLYFWLQAEYEYDDDMSRLFEEDCTADVLADEIIGDDESLYSEESPVEGPTPVDLPLSPAQISAPRPISMAINVIPPTNIPSPTKISSTPMDDITHQLNRVKSDDELTAYSHSSDDEDIVSKEAEMMYEEMRGRPVSIMMVRPTDQAEDKKEAHLTLEFGPLSFVFLSWLSPLMRLGAKRPLMPGDLLPLIAEDEASHVERWTDKFFYQLEGFKKQVAPLPSLFKTVFGSGTMFLVWSGILALLSVTATILNPLFVQQIIVAANAPPMPSDPAGAAAWKHGIMVATGGIPLFLTSTYSLGGVLLGLKAGYSFFGRASDQIIKRLGLNIKTTLVSAVYKKSLRLSAEGSQKYSRGYILNLVNVDCDSISKAVELAHQTWAIPFQIIITIVLLARILGVSVWAGVGALMGGVFGLVLIVPIFMRKAAPEFMKSGDRRLKTIREVMDGIKVVKINALEPQFLARIEQIRTEQLGWLKSFNMGIACFVIVGQLANTIMPLAALSLFAHKEGTLSPARIFPAICFFTMLIDPLIALPQLLSAVVVAMTSWGRVYQFLIAEEKVDVSDISDLNSDEAITITGASFTWPDKEGDRTKPVKKEEPEDKKAKKSKSTEKLRPLDEKPETFPVSRKNSAIDFETQGHRSVKVDLPTRKASVETKVAPPAEEGIELEDIVSVRPLLRDVNVSIKKGSLTAVVGSVGSGKSSLLSAMIGEMMRVEGRISTRGSVAYCAQQPWIQTSTLQDNILFGKPLDLNRLEDAIITTGLKADLENFTHGLSTEIGEKGINLSGGQRARLALARAVYSAADVYLLDDPLAALDPRVGRYVFEKCVKGGLANKTRVLVTHQLQYLSQVDHIIVIADGEIVEQGTYAQLARRGGELTRLLNDIQAFTNSAPAVDTPKVIRRRSVAKSIQKESVVKSEDADVFIVDEERMVGDITAATWWAYIKATGGIPMALLLLVEIFIYQGSTIILNQWLTWWTENKFHEKVNTNIGIYTGIGGAVAVLLTILNVSILLGALRASRYFHSKALNGVLNAPMWWFESQPIGRIMNRFSKDIEAIDQRLMPQVFQLVAGGGTLLSTLVILGYSVPVTLAFAFPLLGVYYYVLRFYRKSLRELKRLEATQRSPLQARISETLDGIPTIIAYKREKDFESSVGALLDQSNQPVFLKFNAEIWVTLRLEMLSSLVLFLLTMLAHTKFVGTTMQFALALTYANSLNYIMNLVLRSSANVEAEMNAVERLLEYTDDLPAEAPAYIGSDPSPDVWPSRGEIVCRGLTAAYHSRPDKPVLRDVSLTFEAGETIYICGRTGSGKSTLLSVLLRLIEIGEGSVEIDGRDISSLGVASLRGGMQLIPQDPFLFSGTIRSTLDFHSTYDDETLWRALDLVGMKPFISQQEQKLDTPVTGNGANYSVGQRQLLCLAGAILRQPKILLLDEATASIDVGSDVAIQQTMRANCPNATILSVMHRLGDRILDECDKVLVMEQGVAIEFASPRELLARPGSMFGKLMEAAKSH